jgi:coenzyme F420-dependent glucose-6-phosphate dehydrogenase
VSHRGRHFQTKEAYLHTRPERQPPIYVSAFGPRSAGIAGRLADGLWTLADPDQAPKVIDAYRSASEDAGRPPGEIVLQLQFSWAESDEQALEGARVWKGAQPSEFYIEDWHDPRKMYERGEQQVSDEQLRETIAISAEPEVHRERIRDIEKIGPTIIAAMNVSGADPHGAIETYAREVLPALRGERVG